MMPDHLVFVEANDIGLHGVRRAVELGLNVTFITSDARAYQYKNTIPPDLLKRGLHVRRIADTGDSRALEAELGDIIRKQPLTGLIAGTESGLPAAAAAAEKLGIPFTSKEAIYTTTNKQLARQVLADKNIPSARFSTVERLEDLLVTGQRFGFPFIVKPSPGRDSFMCEIISDTDSLINYCATVKREFSQWPLVETSELASCFLLEECLTGVLISAEISVDVYGAVTLFMVSKSRRSTKNPTKALGAQIATSLPPDEIAKIEKYVRNLVEAFGFNFGMAHIELFVTASGIRLVEFNPRLMGGTLPLLFGAANGYPVWDEWISIYCRQPSKYRYSVTRNCAGSWVIASFNGGKISNQLPPNWLDPIVHEFANWNVPAVPDQIVSPYKNGSDAIGYFQITAPTEQELNEKGDRLLKWIERRLGVELAV